MSRSGKRSARMALIIFVTALIGTVYALLGESGLMTVMNMRARATQLRHEIAVKESTNGELRDIIRPLREEDPEAIEKLAREKHFMARPGDTVYVLPPEAPKRQPEPERLKPGSPTAPALPRRR